MSELTEFLLARIAEDEAAAAAAGSEQWRVRAIYRHPDSTVTVFRPDAGGRPDIIPGAETYSPVEIDRPIAEHIARHDPARVLAECEAKRRIVERCTAVTDRLSYGDWEYTDAPDLADDTLHMLAAPYVTHPDYRAEWAV